MTTELAAVLVTMPFGPLDSPALGLSLLQAEARRGGTRCDVRYLTFPYAEFVGAAEYVWLSDGVPYNSFAGDWLFTEALFGSRPDIDAAYEREILRGRYHLTDVDVQRLRRARAYAEPFLEHCLTDVPWGSYDVIGFTSTFQQNLASLALARRVKDRCPSATVVFGGANWEGEMGEALHRRFPFVDVACSGEADESFPALLDALREGGPLREVPGIAYRERDGATRRRPARPVEDLDALPYPCFDDYFAELASSPCSVDLTPRLLVETARGCWWGERSHCTFCGLNGASMAFRSKSPERAHAELMYLVERYEVVTVGVVDNILDMRYFRTLLPALADGPALRLFWEIKANLSRQQVRTLARAGARQVQPGIESMSDHVLDLLAKGTTMLRNVQLLKWAREYGVRIEWNLLIGVPGEAPEDYEQQVSLFDQLDFLDPPGACGPIRLDRFSPYHTDPSAYGIAGVRPAEAYRYLYDLDDAELMRIAYYFDFDNPNGTDPLDYVTPALAAVERWRARRDAGSALWMTTRPGGDVSIVDHRVGRPRRSATISGWKANVYKACDRARSRAEIEQAPGVDEVPAEDLSAFLRRCVEVGVMVTDGRRWLALAVHVPARDDAAPSELPITRIPFAVGHG